MEGLREHLQPLRYFIPPEEKLTTSESRHERIRVGVITSIRDLIEEGMIVEPGEQESLLQTRVKGTLEYAVEQMRRGALAHYAELGLVLYDDTKRDLEKLGDKLPLRPERTAPWIHPPNLRTKSGELVTSLTRNVPSNFRHIPLKNIQERDTEKRKFEDTVRRVMEMEDIDILISDHFLCRVQYLIDPRHHDLENKVLNTHPGISDAAHRFRTPGNTPYVDAIERAQGQYGQPHFRTGASFHVMRQEIDAGPVIFDIERTPVYVNDDWSQLCQRNYPLSKNPAFVEGLAHYAQQFYPRLAQIDFSHLEPVGSESFLYHQELNSQSA